MVAARAKVSNNHCPDKALQQGPVADGNKLILVLHAALPNATATRISATTRQRGTRLKTNCLCHPGHPLPPNTMPGKNMAAKWPDITKTAASPRKASSSSIRPVAALGYWFSINPH
jgi:hypothetical protein